MEVRRRRRQSQAGTHRSKSKLGPTPRSGANQRARGRPSLPGRSEKIAPAFISQSRGRPLDALGLDWPASHGVVTVAEAGPEAAEPAGLGALLESGGD